MIRNFKNEYSNYKKDFINILILFVVCSDVCEPILFTSSTGKLNDSENGGS